MIVNPTENVQIGICNLFHSCVKFAWFLFFSEQFAQLTDRWEKAQAEWKSSKLASTEERAKLQEENKALKEAAAETRRKAKEESDDLQTRLNVANDSIATLRSQNDELSQELQIQTEASSEIAGEAQSQLVRVQNEVAELQAQIGTLGARNAKVESDLQASAWQVKNLEAELARTKDALRVATESEMERSPSPGSDSTGIKVAEPAAEEEEPNDGGGLVTKLDAGDDGDDDGWGDDW